MTNQTEQGAALAPCPFCACSMTITPVLRSWWRLYGDHNERCILFENESDVPQTPDQLEALVADWNRRSPVSTPEGCTSGEEVLRASWRHFAAAFRGAFDNPVARRQQNDEYAQDCRRRFRELDEVLAARAAPVPAGYALVPLEPTDEMEKAFFATATGACASYFADEAGYEGAFKRMYQLMVAATPGDSHAT